MQETVLELQQDKICSDEGLIHVLAKLDNLYLKDTTLQKYKALENFEAYRRPASLPINDFIHEFEKLHHKITSHGSVISEDVLAFRLLKAANLSAPDEKLAKGTADLNYDSMKNQLKKLFSESNSLESTSIKFEESIIQETLACDQQAIDTYYNYSRGRGQGRGSFNNQPSRGQGRGSFPQQSRGPPRGNTQSNRKDQFGRVTRCNVCQSTMHWASECPHRGQSNSTFSSPGEGEHQEALCDETGEYDIVLHQSDLDSPQNLHSLIFEATGCGVLDCGASKTVAGSTWWKMTYGSFDSAKQKDCVFQKSNHCFRFGDGNKYASTMKLNFSGKVGH